MPIDARFPTSIYRSPLGGKDAARFNRQLLAECFRIRDADADGRAWSKKNYPGGFTSYGSLSRVQKLSSVFAELEKRLARHVARLARHVEWDLRGKKLAMTDCWVNIMPPATVHGLHLHPTATVSGTYYVKTPRGAPGLKFEDPRLASTMAAPPKLADARPENRPFIEYPARAGHLLLWESWLRHEVPMNVTSTERVSVSFNWNWF